MKNVGLFGLAAFALVAPLACGSSSSGTGSPGASNAPSSAARARFSAGPSATLTKANGARALSETKRQQSSGGDAMKGNPLGGSDGTSTKNVALRSLRFLDDDGGLGDGTGGDGSAASTCPDLVAEKEHGSCACPSGGSLDYDVPNLEALKASGSTLPDEVSISFSYKACAMDQKKYDGAMSLLMSKKSVVNTGAKASTDAPAPAGGATALNMLVVANDLSIDGEKLDFAFAMDQGSFYYAPSVDEKGAYVLSELSLTGSTKIFAKNGEFDCTQDADGAGQCTSDSGETIAVGGGSGDTGGAGETDDAGTAGDDVDAGN